MNTNQRGAPTLYRRLRLIAWLVAAGFAIVNFIRDGVDMFGAALIAILIALGFAAEFVETRTQRPLKNYLRVALGSLALGLVLLVMPLVMGSGILIGLILWSGVSLAGLIWCVHYERTEPR